MGADNVAKTQHFNGATVADNNANAAKAAATASAGATAAADAAAGAAKSDAAAAFAGADYKDRASFKAAEAANGAAVHAKEAAKAASDANLKNNQDRVAYEKDQLVKGEDQDRLKHVNENTAAKTSEIQGKHDERERANGRLS